MFAVPSPSPTRVAAPVVAGEPPTLALEPVDAERYRTMVVEHFDALWRTLKSLGVAASAVDDAAQQVFLIALRKIRRIEIGSERAFLLGTAVGVAANARRGAARAKEILDADALASRVDPTLNPEQAAILAERRAIVERVLDRMPDDLRVVFVLFELEGLTSIEIASMLEIPVGTVSSRLRRAREQFQSEVKSYREANGVIDRGAPAPMGDRG
ncbi:MAG: sigma-70 family RNA polymerase sigma factor [Labilithrix sp.]